MKVTTLSAPVRYMDDHGRSLLQAFVILDAGASAIFEATSGAVVSVTDTYYKEVGLLVRVVVQKDR